MRCVCCKQDGAAKQCSRCRNTTYCSRTCQARHWNMGHKKVCTAKPMVWIPPEHDLPPMFPGPPGWIHRAEHYIQTLGKLPFMPKLAKKYEEYRECEARTRYLRHFYKKQRYGVNGLLSFKSHVENFIQLGFDLGAKRPPSVLDNGMWSFEEIATTIGVPPLVPKAVRPALPPLVPRCVVCKCECTSECACGVTYCSRDCQRLDIARHAPHCAKVHAKYEFAIALTTRYWQSLAPPERPSLD
ncbi:hypothetical protein H257_00336 [Aphanomyces astaci]|uniref:MYND-type domain-containing protein n=1 Tax=Aphanomyces astaci TaxID=112090 RepID=W4HBB7_APHAT|nr:hypothetical protein H257_00336 [Aphanomyces astaci]ETV88861.1 hypothetical protein H257_00336 [Aphanomyces astaci]|eukprot:XP_009821261.1 hypothetical protein H257_00336 [Aphanomyces astaci]